MANCQNKCFLSLVLKALKIRRKFKLYAAEKEYAKAGNENADVNKCLCTKFSRNYNSVSRSSNRSGRGTGVFNRFLVEDTLENFILKSVFGFLGGILLTYICFMFLVFSLNFTLHRATYICMGLGVILSLGLAFSVKIRCTVFLCIPQLFSKRGRQALLAYAFILALSGPAKNTLHNVEVMSESLACAQEQLKQAENELLKCVHKPNAAAKKSIEKLLERINFAVKDFKNFILQLYRNCFDILETVLQSQKWLYSIALLCHKKMRKPAHHCLDLLADSIDNCQSMNPIPPWKEFCKINPLTQESICSTSEAAFCMKSDVPDCLPVSRLQKQLDVFKHRAMNILYVKIEAHQTYSQSNRSYTYHEEYQGMATEIRQKTDQFLQYFDFMSVIFGIFILVLFVKVIIYRHKFLTEDHYDNRYITSDFVDIDNTRAEFRMETLLPLKPRERMKYIKVTSIRLVPCERVRLLSSFIFLIFATFKIIIHILTDSSLYWILSSVRRDERLLYMSTLREEEPSITVRVVGYGLVAALFRNVTRAVKRQSTTTRLDPTPCLPDPVPPDWNRYYQILALVVICWLLALCEPYGLRLRHTVMVTYHPDRARERAIWLYNRIISNRTSFVKLSRRQIRKKYKDVPREATFRYQFMKNTSSPKCLLCKNTISCVDNRVECSTLHCVGIYCSSCFASLRFCSICCDPADYGDLSDLSEEKDSSEEECLSKPLPKETTSPRITETKEHHRFKTPKRMGLLKLKKPCFKLRKESKCEESKSPRKEKSTCRRLIQPTLLIRALKYCRNKIPAFRQLRNLSDVESSDWDLSSTVCTEFSSVDDKVVTFRSPPIRNKKKKEKKRLKDSAEISKKKKSRKHEKGDKKNKMVRKGEKEMNALCLFERMSPMALGKEAPCMMSSYSSNEDIDVKPKPDFLFKPKKDFKGDSSSEDLPCTFLSAKDSFESIMKKRKGKAPLKLSQTDCNVGILLVKSAEMVEGKQMKPLESCQLPVKSHSRNIISPLELDSRCSESEMQNRITFPFIDPINIHEYASGGGIWSFVEPRERRVSFPQHAREQHRRNRWREGRLRITPVGDPSPVITMPCTPSSAGMCFETNESSQSMNKNFRFRDKDESLSSSSDSDCQFYCQPYRSSFSSSEQTESETIVIKSLPRSSNLYVNSSKESVSYSVETDSSSERLFRSEKPPRRARTVPFCEENSGETELSEEGRNFDGISGKTVCVTREETRVPEENAHKEDEGVERKPDQSEWPPWLSSELPSFYRQCFTDLPDDRK